MMQSGQSKFSSGNPDMKKIKKTAGALAEATEHPAEELESLPAESGADGPNRPFPIIGIGASAGGLEALELFLKNVPVGSGMAYVIVQHLDPIRKGIMVELLQRTTPMPVVQVTDRLTIQPDSVYIIPPNKDMSILHGLLHLFAPAAPRGLRLPIDYFLRSLADDQQEGSIGVILSGMGSDGTLGLRAIKEKAGAAFVQDLTSAKFDGMPRSAIDAGLADVVAAAEDLPAKIYDFLHHTPFLSRPGLSQEGKTQSGMEKVLILLRTQTGHDFSLYKKSTIYRRVERRMGLHQIDRIANYVRLLQENPQETELLFKELLIGVTRFFRDLPAWEYLRDNLLPDLLAAYPKGGELRAWIPGCSTGEEAYSLAMVFKEALEQVKPAANLSLQIFATDLDRDAIEKARQGFYPANIVADVSPDRLSRFFVQEEHGYRVGKQIREMIIFAPQNLVMDAPFTRLDLLVCRNLLIYIEPELQKKLLPTFHYCLNPGGILFLGSAETTAGFGALFSALNLKLRLYRRLDTGSHLDLVDFPTTFFPAVTAVAQKLKQPAAAPQPALNLGLLVDQMVLKNFAPAAVLANPAGDILYFSGRTGKYLEPAAGKANLNIFGMAREGLRYELNGAFQKAIREKTDVTLKNLAIGTNGGTQVIDLTIQPLNAPAGLQGLLLVVFSDVAAHHTPSPSEAARQDIATDAHKKEMEEALYLAQEELQTLHEEMQTSQEELKSTNEELQSTNEELQSTNEELTTSKEEMQSLNEELQTVNHELQARVDDLSRSNNDLKNLLDSTNIATLFLDETLRVRRFTHQASKIINLIPGDAGRPITDIASDVIYPGLAEDVQEVLRSLVFKEKPVTTRTGNWFMVRIMPYRTLDNRIDGVVITFADISIAKKLEAVMRETERETQALFKYMPQAFGLFESVFDEDGRFMDGRFVSVNDAFERILGVNNRDVQGKTFLEVWAGAKPGWIAAFGKVAVSGVPASFRMEDAATGKKFRCDVFRSDLDQAHFCIILEGAGKPGSASEMDEIEEETR
jgi:two-component system CheB/CheR fusion protein